MEKDEIDTLKGLPVRIVDEEYPSSSLKLKPTVDLSISWRSVAGKVFDAPSVSVLFYTKSDADDAIEDYQKKKFSSNWWKRPYAQIFLLKTVDYDAYHAKKSRLAEFVQSCNERNVEWLVGYLSRRGREESKSEKRSLDRLRSSLGVNKGGKDRLITLYQKESGILDATSWEELKSRLRESVCSSVEMKVNAYKEQVNLVYANRILPGWSFCQYVSVGEGLAFIYVQLRRNDLALSMYDDLERIMLERQELGSGFVVKNSDIEVDVMNPLARPYRQMIAAGLISELDLRTYLFASRMDLLMTNQRRIEVGEKALEFLELIQTRCHEEAEKPESNLDGAMPYVWGLFAAKSIVDALSKGMEEFRSAGPNARISYQKVSGLIAKACEHAIEQFRYLVAVYLPNTFPDMPTVREVPDPEKLLKKLKSPELRNALQDADSAWNYYTQLILESCAAFKLAGRSSYAVRLQLKTGLEFLKSGYDKPALELLSGPCEMFANANGWDTLHKEVRLQMATAEKRQNLVQKYILSCLALLRMNCRDRLLPGADETALKSSSEEWINELREAAAQHTQMTEYDLDGLLHISIKPQSGPWTEGGWASVEVHVESPLPCPMKLNCLVVELTNQAGSNARTDKILLQSEGEVVLSPGHSTIVAETKKIPHAGWFQVSTVDLLLEKLKLSSKFGEGSGRSTPSPIFQSKPSFPLQSKFEETCDLLLVNGPLDVTCLTLTASDEASTGSVHMLTSFEEKSSLKTDSTTEITLVDNNSNGKGTQVEVDLPKGGTQHIRVPVEVSDVVPRYMSERGSERKLVEKLLVLDCQIKVGQNDTERIVSRRRKIHLRFWRPFNFIAHLERVSDDHSYLSVEITNEMEEVEIIIDSATFTVSGGMWQADSSEPPPHEDLLPVSLRPATSTSVAYGIRRKKRNSTDDEDCIAAVSIQMEARYKNDEKQRHVAGGVCSLNSLILNDSHFKINRNIDRETTVGKQISYEFSVECTSAEVKEFSEDNSILYDIKYDSKDWLVAGKQRGVLTQFGVVWQLEVVALRNGLIQPPEVQIFCGTQSNRENKFNVEHIDNILRVRVLPESKIIQPCERLSKNSPASPLFELLERNRSTSTKLSNQDFTIEKLM